MSATIVSAQPAATSSSFTMAQVKSYPFPNGLTAASSGSRIAWALNEQRLRNLWAAEGPEFKPRRLTNYGIDDGQELTSISISPDGRHVIYVRRGDHGSNWDAELPVNPTANPAGFKVELWSVPFDGGAPKALAEGDDPVISPRGDRAAFARKDWDRRAGAKALDRVLAVSRNRHRRGECCAPHITRVDGLRSPSKTGGSGPHLPPGLEAFGSRHRR